jgi:hypothetical protein
VHPAGTRVAPGTERGCLSRSVSASGRAPGELLRQYPFVAAAAETAALRWYWRVRAEPETTDQTAQAWSRRFPNLKLGLAVQPEAPEAVPLQQIQ